MESLTRLQKDTGVLAVCVLEIFSYLVGGPGGGGDGGVEYSLITGHGAGTGPDVTERSERDERRARTEPGLTSPECRTVSWSERSKSGQR